MKFLSCSILLSLTVFALTMGLTGTRATAESQAGTTSVEQRQDLRQDNRQEFLDNRQERVGERRDNRQDDRQEFRDNRQARVGERRDNRQDNRQEFRDNL